MKYVVINPYQVGLVFKRNVYLKMISEGEYWLWNRSVLIYEKNLQFVPPIDLTILLKDQELANALMVIEVKDNEIALQYENNLLKQVLGPGRYAFWKGIVEYEFVKADISKVDIDPIIDRNILQNRMLASFVRTVQIEPYEKALLFLDGKFAEVLQGGTYYFWKNSITISVAKVDLRQQQLEISGQEILTKDKAALRINAWAQYQVADIEKAIMGNKEYDKQLYVALQLALRAYVSGFTFDELLEKKDSLTAFVLQAIKDKADQLGVEVSDFGVRDIILPGDMKDIMNQVLIAEKKAQANTITRREETASTRSLLNTAKLMEENAMLWKLKEMEYVEKIADKISNISVSGNGMLVEQLKQIFVPQK